MAKSVTFEIYIPPRSVAQTEKQIRKRYLISTALFVLHKGVSFVFSFFFFPSFFSTGILGLLGAILYAALRESDQGDLSWGFAAFVSGHVVAVTLFVTLFALHVCQPKRKPVVKPYYM